MPGTKLAKEWPQAHAPRQTMSDREYVLTHRPSGRVYRFLGTAIRENDLEPMIVYQHREDGTVWTRPAVDFFNARDGSGEPKWSWPVSSSMLMGYLRAQLQKCLDGRGAHAPSGREKSDG